MPIRIACRVVADGRPGIAVAKFLVAASDEAGIITVCPAMNREAL